MTRPFALPIVAALALAAGGCNATGATPLPTATTAPLATAAPQSTPLPAITTPADLQGTWTSDVEGTSASSGIWTLTISNSNWTLQNPVGGDLFSIGPIAVTETSLLLAADSGCPDQSTVTTGTYTLALTGDSLKITLVSDSCGDRSATLVAGPWTRKR
jgi:hypothetical protein